MLSGVGSNKPAVFIVEDNTVVTKTCSPVLAIPLICCISVVNVVVVVVTILSSLYKRSFLFSLS